MTSEWFATCPKGLEGLLAAELQTLGAESSRETVAGVYFSGAQAMGYRACLWSRLANKVLRPLASFEVEDGDQLYTQLKGFDWSRVLSARNSIAIDFSGTNRSIRNTQFGAQRCKDAVVDWFKENGGHRPAVDRRSPDVRLNVRLSRGKVALAIDYSGASLHQRGYRQQQGAAPLKENLAAAILLRADWPGAAARGGALIDPMCGSATLLLEGAMMAADIAPGLGRKRFGFEKLPEHNDTQWRAILADARGRAERGRAAQLPEIRGYDADPKVIRRAQENIAQLGMEKVVRVAVKPLAEQKKPTHKPLPYGLLVCNPPYGERLGEKRSLVRLYGQLGQLMSREFAGWDAAVFTSDLELGRAIGLRSHKRYALYNGALEAHLLLLQLTDNHYREVAATAREPAAQETSAQPVELTEGATMFANRIRKNQRRLKSWLKREQVQCYRLYDADMPEYAVAVDIYGDHAHVAEYQAPKGIDPQAASQRLDEVKLALPEALGLPVERIVFKQRQRQRGLSQYEKQDAAGEFLTVTEGQARLLVNLRDYLDTGLFLDHRPLRLRIGREARSKHFLNLFCYTGTASVHAALGGAHSTTSVDMSKTYLGWLKRNLASNGLGDASNRVEQGDCQAWLARCQRQYDLILLDPPSFSNSKRMEGTFDVQRDQVALVEAAMRVLAPGGTLYFSNNRRGFKLDPDLEASYQCEDISGKTLDPDFQRNPKIHRCWQIQHA
ncbi:23S rRNA (guanine(2445)-N(2))/(guanine(2069)-N(7))-methyltransferase [Halioglobus sp. HI00S01]|uniref:bifunctional 23S rRNA (guanine(2069)-N(7))-methyltransferase RlmK/23S rRNA (guanine(2445)-N(2))-methyltransferase RlmL n=1 Tax=Halioglobus sp. HI00S01 TaxID=1822214 RepID=UPI0007C39B53|nr:bifunctional 23S rRNA (guanine(2069)-N(7))-methyltransferase RlmK/23S rRNA (guanine(2445)-N(2))-methyltransferase RlmL [Halioglobus sp. HI00S01]KZX60140.1 23S rRNA (guanine(2445)-N(2))/(guanine(2069)-N(7))-methyltransferase [Halioglobus sp. HI00S01]